MVLPYSRPDELRDRYQDSVIFLRGDPIYISGVHDGLLLGFNPLPMVGKVPSTIPARDPGLTDVPEHIGYMNGGKYIGKEGNYVGAATFVQRMPVRRSKQGLDSQNLFFPAEVPMNFNTALKMSEFSQMFQNSYPPWETAKKVVVSSGKNLKTLAFHKNFALEFNRLDLFVLHYKGREVASSRHGGAFDLSNQYKHLAETLNDLGVKAA